MKIIKHFEVLFLVCSLSGMAEEEDYHKYHQENPLFIESQTSDNSLVTWQNIKEKLKIGQQITGPIKNIKDELGLFIKIAPDITGLVHKSNVSWTQCLDHLTDVYTVGEEIKVVILNIDQPNQRIALGIKQLYPGFLYTNHIKEKMEKSRVAEEDIECVIQTGQKFADLKYPESILYRDTSKKKAQQLVVVTKPGKSINEHVLITLFYAKNPGNLPKRKSAPKKHLQ